MRLSIIVFLLHKLFFGYFRFQGSVKALEDKNKKLTLVDGDGLDLKVSSFMSSKLLSLENKRSFHTCYRCNKIFCHSVLFVSHFRHCKDKKHKCRKCKDEFSSKDSLLTHYMSCLEFYCWHCKKQFVSQASLKIHFLSKHFLDSDLFVHSKHDFRCELCLEVFYDSVTNVSECYSKYKNIVCNACEQIKNCALNVTLEFSESETVMVIKPMLSQPNDNIVIDDNLLSPTPGISSVELNTVNLLGNKTYKHKVDFHLIDKNVTEDCNALTKYEAKIDELFHLEWRKTFIPKTLCSICEDPKDFKSYYCLKLHRKKVHGLVKIFDDAKYVCAFCIIKINSPIEMSNHIYKSHVPYLKCDHCDVLFPSLNVKSFHMKKVHPQLGKLCLYCPFLLSNISAQEKKNHTSWHRLKEPLACETCNKVVIGRDRLLGHLHIHRRQLKEPLLCTHCGQFDRFLHSHANQSKEKMRLCLTCGKLLTRKKYRSHMNTKQCRPASRNPAKPKQCSYCDKIFSDSKREFEHRRIVHEKHLYLPCHYCLRKFPFRYEVNRHVKKFHPEFASGLRPQTITMKEITTQPQSPRTITKKNTTTKPPPPKVCPTFSCYECTELFKTQIQLANHLRIHHGIVEKKYECQYCSRVFIRKDTLEAHLRIHTGELPYSCQVCGQRFRQVGGCRRHQARHGISLPREQRAYRKKTATVQPTFAKDGLADDEILPQTFQFDAHDMENAQVEEMHFSRKKHSGGKVSQRYLQQHVHDPEIVHKRHGVPLPSEQRVYRKKTATVQEIPGREGLADDEIHPQTSQFDVPYMENAQVEEMHFSRKKHSSGKVSQRSSRHHIYDSEFVHKRESDRLFTKKQKFVGEKEIENRTSRKKSGGKFSQPFCLFDMPHLGD